MATIKDLQWSDMFCFLLPNMFSYILETCQIVSITWVISVFTLE